MLENEIGSAEHVGQAPEKARRLTWILSRAVQASHLAKHILVEQVRISPSEAPPRIGEQDDELNEPHQSEVELLVLLDDCDQH